MAVYTRRFWASYSPRWELEISHGYRNVVNIFIQITCTENTLWTTSYIH
jgi:hypothetical protein